ncbi:MAG: hypothetical protein GY795_34330 [Desulfobacterales bacterium]|nr:hypothetical protein [Desulfobacterales bacterium]
MSSKSKKKSKQRKQFKPKIRKQDALKWLSSFGTPGDLLASYSKRYGCSKIDAETELMELGYYDEIQNPIL